MVAQEDHTQASRLASAILDGSADAEALLYDRYHKQLVVILRGRGVPPSQREDIAHEAYIVTLQRLRDGELEQPELLGRYLKRTAINLWLNELRKQIRHGDVPLDSTDEVAGGDDGERQTAIAEASDAVMSVVGELTQERDRLVLILTFVHDWDKQSICDYLGLDGRTYDNVRSRALKRCREVIAKDPRRGDSLRVVLEELDR